MALELGAKRKFKPRDSRSDCCSLLKCLNFVSNRHVKGTPDRDLRAALFLISEELKFDGNFSVSLAEVFRSSSEGFLM